MFYETLARYYDLIFPLEAAKVTFLTEEFTRVKARTILDVACGTGTYALALAEKGFAAWGTDLSAEMIGQAQRKAARLGLPVRFAAGDMREPGTFGITFDGLFCIGNSLAHLTAEDELRQAVTAMRETLRPGGAAVFQTVNFDRILDRGDTPLPVIEREKLRFIRIYRPVSTELLHFYSRLEIKTDDGAADVFEHTINLLPLRRKDLEQCLRAAGFSGIASYGDFRRSPYTHDSPATVISALA
ncbi:MAG TPA: class I SAM-dependent methyltransferase [Firmicutes bacterium]|nr:class I SAM-dependent methyltransferase [Bacillota bacterium]